MRPSSSSMLLAVRSGHGKGHRSVWTLQTHRLHIRRSLLPSTLSLPRSLPDCPPSPSVPPLFWFFRHDKSSRGIWLPEPPADELQVPTQRGDRHEATQEAAIRLQSSSKSKVFDNQNYKYNEDDKNYRNYKNCRSNRNIIGNTSTQDVPHLLSLPPYLSRLGIPVEFKDLTMLSFKSCRLTYIPDTIDSLKKIEKLYLEENLIDFCPVSLSKLTTLIILGKDVFIFVYLICKSFLLFFLSRLV